MGLWMIVAVNWGSRATELPQRLSFSIRSTFLPPPSLYSHLPSRSTKVIDCICATQANIQSPQAPDLWSVKHLAVLILSPSEQLCIQRPASPPPPGNNGLSPQPAKWGVKLNGKWFVFHIFWVKGSCVCLMNLGLFGHCHNWLKVSHHLLQDPAKRLKVQRLVIYFLCFTNYMFLILAYCFQNLCGVLFDL